MTGPSDAKPLLIVTDAAARLVRRGLLTHVEADTAHWRGARILVFRRGPVVCVDAPPQGSYVSAAPWPSRCTTP